MCHKVLVLQLGVHTFEESLQVLQLGLHLLKLGLHVNQSAQTYCILLGAYHERGCALALGSNYYNIIQSSHLQDHAVKRCERVCTHSLNSKRLTRAYVLGLAHRADLGNNLFCILKLSQKLGIGLTLYQINYSLVHYALAVLALTYRMPKFLSYERHEGMQQHKQLLKHIKCGSIGLRVNGLSINRLDDLQVPACEFIPEQLINSHQGLADAVL